MLLSRSLEALVHLFQSIGTIILSKPALSYYIFKRKCRLLATGTRLLRRRQLQTVQVSARLYIATVMSGGSTRHLVIRDGTTSETIPREHLARYPGSLLATVAGDDHEAEDSSIPVLNRDSEEVAVDINSGLQSIAGDWSPAIVAAMYRDGFLPAAIVQDLLIRGTTHDELCNQIRQLLAYLDLPGPVLEWLPPLSSIPLRQSSVLHLWNTTWARQKADEAVQLIMEFKPHLSSYQPLGLAAFVVAAHRDPCCGAAGICRAEDPALRVYALQYPHDYLLKAICRDELDLHPGVVGQCLYLQEEDLPAGSSVQKVPVVDDRISLNSIESVRGNDTSSIIGPHHPVFGISLCKSFKAAIENTPCCVMPARIGDCWVWVFRW